MKIRLTAAAGLSAVLLLSACAANEPGGNAAPDAPTGTSSASDSESTAPALEGTIQGIGASSMKKAQELWIANYAGVQPSVTINYDDKGSGAGRDAFIAGGADYAGSDRAFKVEENVAGSFGKCTTEAHAIDLPVYISPIAVVFNLGDIQELDLTSETVAKIFMGQITKWNDPAIAATNSGVTLPDTDIAIVHRSDKSGTTENFTDWLNVAAPEVWTEKGDQEWKGAGGDAADGTSGVMTAVTGAVGTIGYADLSQAKGVGIAKINGVTPSEEDAAKAVEASPIETEGRLAGDIAIKIDRKAEGYPIVLVSYAIACSEYQDSNTAAIIKEFLSYVASEDGQQAASEQVGSAPLSAALRDQVLASIDAIK